MNSSWDDTLKGNFTFQFVQIEILLAQDQIFNTLNENNKTELLKEAARKYEVKKSTNEFSDFSEGPSILIAGRILDKRNKLQDLKGKMTTESIEKFLLTGSADNKEIF